MTSTHIPTIDELIELPDPEDAQISPDGRLVAYQAASPDWKENRYVSQIWLAAVEDDVAPRQLTFAKQSSVSPRWSPDGQWLAFRSQRDEDEQTQIYRMHAFGGEAERLTELPGDVQAFEWSPDGQSIACLVEDPEDQAWKDRQERFGDYRVEDQDYRRHHLWLLQLDDRRTRKLTGGESMHVESFRWDPGSERIAFEAWPSPDLEHWGKGLIRVLDVQSLAQEELTGPGTGSPLWSPDGSQLAYWRAGEPSFIANQEICVLPVDGSDERIISAGFDENPHLLAWGPDGIYFWAIKRTAVHLYRIDPASGAVDQLTPESSDGWISLEASFTQDFGMAGLVTYDAAHCGEVAALHVADRRVRRLTDYTGRTRDWQLGQHEVIRWKSRDDTEIEGILTKPPDFDPNQRYPLLVIIHGGPTWSSFPMRVSWFDSMAYPSPLWVAKGALILQPNYRGSAGYGEAFRRLNMRNLGAGDAWDVESGVDALIERGWVDPERVGAMGWSQGGYISAFLATNSDRFQSLSVGAGVSNWVTYYVNTDVHPFTRQYLEATPWDDMDVYRKTSPMTNIRRARTPTLIQHGENDHRVPAPNAYELYQGLKDVGVEAKLVIYENTRHGIGKPRLNRQAMQENLDWFNRWIWGELPKARAERACYVALCSADKRGDGGDLPALQRYTARRIQSVHDWARRDGADFRILSGQFGLLRADDPIPWYDHALQAAEVSAMAERVGGQLQDQGLQKLVLYTDEIESDRHQLIYLGCLQVAAAMVEGVIVEHRPVAEKDW